MGQVRTTYCAMILGAIAEPLVHVDFSSRTAAAERRGLGVLISDGTCVLRQLSCPLARCVQDQSRPALTADGSVGSEVWCRTGSLASDTGLWQWWRNRRISISPLSLSRAAVATPVCPKVQG